MEFSANDINRFYHTYNGANIENIKDDVLRERLRKLDVANQNGNKNVDEDELNSLQIDDLDIVGLTNQASDAEAEVDNNAARRNSQGAFTIADVGDFLGTYYGASINSVEDEQLKDMLLNADLRNYSRLNNKGKADESELMDLKLGGLDIKSLSSADTTSQLQTDANGQPKNGVELSANGKIEQTYKDGKLVSEHDTTTGLSAYYDYLADGGQIDRFYKTNADGTLEYIRREKYDAEGNFVEKTNAPDAATQTNSATIGDVANFKNAYSGKKIEDVKDEALKAALLELDKANGNGIIDDAEINKLNPKDFDFAALTKQMTEAQTDTAAKKEPTIEDVINFANAYAGKKIEDVKDEALKAVLLELDKANGGNGIIDGNELYALEINDFDIVGLTEQITKPADATGADAAAGTGADPVTAKAFSAITLEGAKGNNEIMLKHLIGHDEFLNGDFDKDVKSDRTNNKELDQAEAETFMNNLLKFSKTGVIDEDAISEWKKANELVGSHGKELSEMKPADAFESIKQIFGEYFPDKFTAAPATAAQTQTTIEAAFAKGEQTLDIGPDGYANLSQEDKKVAYQKAVLELVQGELEKYDTDGIKGLSFEEFKARQIAEQRARDKGETPEEVFDAALKTPESLAAMQLIFELLNRNNDEVLSIEELSARFALMDFDDGELNGVLNLLFEFPTKLEGVKDVLDDLREQFFS